MCNHKWQLVFSWEGEKQIMYWKCEECGKIKPYCEWDCNGEWNYLIEEI